MDSKMQLALFIRSTKMNKQFKAIIRADGNSQIGMGHIVRTSVLADELSQNMDIIYVVLEDSDKGIEFLKQKGYRVEVVDRENIYRVFNTLKADLIITDHYGINQEYIQKVRELFPVVAYISDYSNQPLEADFIINQNFMAEQLQYKTNINCKKLLGSQFAMLREEFRNASPIEINDTIMDIFVTVGGGDPNNWMQYILNQLRLDRYRYHVIIGPGFSHQKALYKAFKENKNVIFYENAKLCNIMQKCDLAISTCGSTLYELGSLGIPTIGVSLADNQIPIGNEMGEYGCIMYLGDLRHGLTMKIDQAIEQLNLDKGMRMKMQQLNQQAINPNGVLKIKEHIMKKLI